MHGIAFFRENTEHITLCFSIDKFLTEIYFSIFVCETAVAAASFDFWIIGLIIGLIIIIIVILLIIYIICRRKMLEGTYPGM